MRLALCGTLFHYGANKKGSELPVAAPLTDLLNIWICRGLGKIRSA
ncbi:Hypothetical protein LUCI_4328 [Lucifera butyrica]|uniref:Uncharacterized protein n=1 Tax=Lucifera butyrica TaxID=1351585 RepID=A0A498RG38_9FIRM|nr:Hypothetical protein LUCI_4328 [Lucifera butyrica]